MSVFLSFCAFQSDIMNIREFYGSCQQNFMD